MPHLCLFGCRPKDLVLQLHILPNPKKNPERFKAWVNLVGGKLDIPANYEYCKTRRVCHLHFTDEHRNRFYRLSANAVPTILLPGSDEAVLHSFPNPKIHKERFLLWAQAAGPAVVSLDPQYVYKRRRICHTHFETEYLTYNRRLTHLAVPTLHIGNRNNKTIEINANSQENETNSKPLCSNEDETPRIDLLPTKESHQLKLDLAEVGDLIDLIEAYSDNENPPSPLAQLSAVPSPEISEEIAETDDEGEKIFSWQKAELIETDDSKVESPAPVHKQKTYEDVVTLSMHCDEPESNQPSKPDIVVVADPVEYHCKDCEVVINGFSFWCVQCARGPLCCACAAGAAHDAHYGLRAPGGATLKQTRALLILIRQQLLEKKLLTLYEIDENDVKVEVKAEPSDLFSPSARLPRDPLSADFGQTADFERKSSLEIVELQSEETQPEDILDQETVDNHPFKRPRLINKRIDKPTTVTTKGDARQRSSLKVPPNILKGSQTPGIKIIPNDHSGSKTRIKIQPRDRTGPQSDREIVYTNGTITLSGIKNIASDGSQTQSDRKSLPKEGTRTESGIKFIHKDSPGSQSGIKIITKNSPGSQSGIKIISKDSPGSQSGIKMISKDSPESQSGIKIISKDSPGSQPGIKIISKDSPGSQSGIKIISKDSPGSQSGIKIISKDSPGSQSGIKIISKDSPGSQSGIKIISKDSPGSQSGIKIIPSDHSRSKADITNITTIPSNGMSIRSGINIIPNHPTVSQSLEKVLTSDHPVSQSLIKVIPSDTIRLHLPSRLGGSIILTKTQPNLRRLDNTLKLKPVQSVPKGTRLLRLPQNPKGLPIRKEVAKVTTPQKNQPPLSESVILNEAVNDEIQILDEELLAEHEQDRLEIEHLQDKLEDSVTGRETEKKSRIDEENRTGPDSNTKCMIEDNSDLDKDYRIDEEERIDEDSIDETDLEDIADGVGSRTRNATKMAMRGPSEAMRQMLTSDAAVQLQPLTSIDIRKWLANRKRPRSD